MSDSLSVEAAVAGEAAAAAVEEVQSREAVDAAATEAVITADTAIENSTLAVESALSAQSQSDEAVRAAAEAAESAAAASEQAATVAYMTEEAFATYNAANDAKLREMREYIDARVPLPTPSQSTVEEVDADDRTSVSNPGESGTSEDTSQGEVGSAGGAGEKKRGLRHRTR